MNLYVKFFALVRKALPSIYCNVVSNIGNKGEWAKMYGREPTLIFLCKKTLSSGWCKIRESIRKVRVSEIYNGCMHDNDIPISNA